MRVIAGTARRLTLRTLEGKATRPTTDKIKETLFNILQPDLQGCRFLDLYAGSGQIGIEALSRGAESAVFVDNSRLAAECIRFNLTHTHFTDSAQVIQSDSVSAVRRLNGQEAFDIIFIDPPYQAQQEPEILRALGASTLAGPETLIVVEAAVDTSFDCAESCGFEVIRRKEYKNNVHVFLRRQSNADV